MINVHLEVGVQDSPDSCKSTALAQAIERSAEEVVRAYWAAMRAQDWAKYVQLIHPKSLSEARQYANLLAKALSELGTGGNLHSYVGVTSLEEFDRLKDRDVLERLMPRLIPSVIAERILKATTFDIVGAAKEKEDIIHILYRGDIKLEDSEGKRLQVVEVEDSGKLVSRHYTIKLPEPNQERIEVLTLKKDGAYWKIILPEEIVEDILSLKDQIDEGKEHLLKFAEVLKAQKKPKPKTKRSTLRR